MPDDMQRALSELERSGLLLLTDPEAPCLTALVAGEHVAGSWWSHPAGRRIFAVSQALEEHADVTAAPLLSRKVTFVHRRAFADLLAVATSREPWQLRALLPVHLELLARIDASGTLRPGSKDETARLRELERRLLVRGSEEHSPTGRHVKVAESWAAWSARVRAPPPTRDVGTARSSLETMAADVAAVIGPRCLPWT